MYYKLQLRLSSYLTLENTVIIMLNNTFFFIAEYVEVNYVGS
jgi:hypothetical protein